MQFNNIAYTLDVVTQFALCTISYIVFIHAQPVYCYTISFRCNSVRRTPKSSVIYGNHLAEPRIT